MQTIIPWSQLSSIPRAGDRRTILLPVLVLLPLLLAACIPQAAGKPSPSITPAPSSTPQIATPTDSLHPTITADSENPLDRTTRPTPDMVDEPVVPTSGSPIVGEVPAELLDDIIVDLAERQEISADEITVIQARPVEWNDGSLGCPQPGMMNIQVITPGFRVIIHANGGYYDYHTDARGNFILCGDGSTIEPIPLMPVAPHGKPQK